jgi:hypothetical protein
MSHGCAKQLLRAIAEGYPKSFVVTGGCISTRSDFVKQIVICEDLKDLYWLCLTDWSLLQKALHLVHLVEERLQSSVSLWPLLPRQLLRNRELQLVDGMISVLILLKFSAVGFNIWKTRVYHCSYSAITDINSVPTTILNGVGSHKTKTTNSVASVCERTIRTERLPLDGKVSSNFCE